jgi:hypothetical protein
MIAAIAKRRSTLVPALLPRYALGDGIKILDAFAAGCHALHIDRLATAC